MTGRAVTSRAARHACVGIRSGGPGSCLWSHDCLHIVNGKVVMALRNSRYKTLDKKMKFDAELEVKVGRGFYDST